MKTILPKKAMVLLCAFFGAMFTLALHSTSWAEEGGSGHYMPGATASFIDTLPGKPGFAYVHQFLYYGGSAGSGRELLLGGKLAWDIKANVYADNSVFLYETPFKILGGNYATALAASYVCMDIETGGTVTGSRGRQLSSTRMRDTASGIGDLFVIPFILGWSQQDLKYDFRFGFYAPTGEYHGGNLANVGRNFWTFEPSVSVSYLGSRTGLEVTGFLGLDLNTENNATRYTTGDQLHLDLTVAEHLPLGKGFVGIGAGCFYYQQITADSGPGAVLGGLEGRSLGIGPVLSYTRKINKVDLVAEVKWLPEMDVKNRLNGDIFWAKIAVLF